MIRVVIVDDHTLIREGLKIHFDRANDIDVVAMFDDGKGLLGHLLDLSPDVLLTDLNAPYHDPLVLVTTLAEELPATRVAVLTGSEDVARFRRLLEAGVAAIQLKTDDHDPAELVRMVHRGEHYLSDEVVRRLAEN